jgi:CubicO group peptidase (beta-lactamase class C family)
MNQNSVSHRQFVPPLLIALAAAALAVSLHGQRAVPVPAAPPGRASCVAPPDVLDAAVRDLHERQRNVGLSAAILLRGRVVASWSLGMADLESRRPVTSRTRFGIASITKAFTGVALLQAHQRGQVDLDAPIQRYVPSFPVKPGVPITLRLLAAHLAGIRHWGPERGPALYARHFDDVNDVLPLFAADPLVVPAGSKYSYSSYGYNLIAAALESATRVQFQRLVTTRILEPLRLHDTGFDDVRRADQRVARRYSYYDVDSGADLAAPVRVPNWDYSHNISGGNMSSTAEDLVRFARALARPGLLTPASIELLAAMPTVGAVESPMSFGWFVAARPEAPRVAHHRVECRFAGGALRLPGRRPCGGRAVEHVGRGLEVRGDGRTAAPTGPAVFG